MVIRTCQLVVALVAGFLLLLSGRVGATPLESSQPADPSRGPTIPFELFHGSQIFVNATINGVPTTAMLDSGASITAVDSTFAARIGLGTGRQTKVRGTVGEIQGQDVRGVDLVVGNLRLHKPHVTVLDLSPLARELGHDLPVILGRDVFEAGIVSIDFPHHQIQFTERASFRPSGAAVPLRLRRKYGLPFVTIDIGGKREWAELDLGSDGTVLLANRTWMSRPDIAGLPHGSASVTAVGGTISLRSVVLPEVIIGETRFLNLPAKLVERDGHGVIDKVGANVGIEMMKPFVATFDVADGLLYLEGPRLVQH